MTINREHKNIGLLFGSQAMFMTGQVVLVTLSGLVGQTLASDKSLATLPVSTVVLATAMTTVFASMLMKRFGRRAGFMIGATIGLIGVALSVYAIWTRAFWLFVAATFIIGINGGFAQYYRFAAAEVASPEFRSKAISLVISGGIAAAVLGPLLVRQTDGLVAMPFIGPYVALTAVSLATIILLAFLAIPKPSDGEIGSSGRPLARITRAPAFIVAVLTGTTGYAAMSLIMTATPIAMFAKGFNIPDTAMVIEWHVLAMYVPALFTGSLIYRFGTLKVMFSGLMLLFISIGLALNGTSIAYFSIALSALGLGWNFTFVGASSLLTETYRPSERAKVQATNDFLLFGTVAAASLSSGALLNAYGWNTVNLFALPFLVITALVVLWYAVSRRRIKKQA